MRTAASGMLAQQMQVDAIANNIANANTTAYKKDHLSFRSLLYRTYREPGALTGSNIAAPTGLQIGSGTEIGSSIKLQTQGDLELTGNEFDLGIQGDGFFRVALGNGEFRYTRDGTFRRDAVGQIVTVDGYFLEPRIVVPEGTTAITIGQDGTVSGQTPGGQINSFGQILLFDFTNPAGLKASGGNLYQETGSSGPAVQRVAGQDGTGFLRQAMRERSNVQVVEELIELIQAQRNYEVNSRTIRVGDEMLQQVSNLVR